MCSFGGALTVLVASSGGGMLGVHLLADDVWPQWAESAPLCLAEDSRLLSVQSEVRHQPLHYRLLLKPSVKADWPAILAVPSGGMRAIIFEGTQNTA